ncbi:hypothetical protein Tco_1463375 [Tanacetum coccineum]
MRGFRGCQGEMKKGRAKVAWETVCKPKSTRGLVPSVYSEACLSYVVGYESEIEDAKPFEAMGCLEYGADTFGNGLFAPRFEDVVEFLIPSSKGRSTRSITSRIVLAPLVILNGKRGMQDYSRRSRSHIH